jgi:selenocysteine-specific elongation factor
VALTGSDLEREDLSRGQVLVTDDAWRASSTLTVELRVLADSAWAVEHGQRVRVHLGTAERMARVVLFERDALLPGEAGLAQLRLEGPVVARARERTTIGGGTVAEPEAPKRSGLTDADHLRLRAVLEGADDEAVAARAGLAGWRGEPLTHLPVTTGLVPQRCEEALGRLGTVAEWTPAGSDAPRRLANAIVGAQFVREAAERIESAVAAHHAAHPLQRGLDLEAARQTLPKDSHPDLADAVLGALVSAGRVALHQRLVSLPGYERTLTSDQSACLEELAATFRAAALAPPSLGELPAPLARRPDLRELVGLLEEDGRLTRLEPDLFISRDTLESAAAELTRALGGRSALGPADFKDVLPVTRKHLLPILGYFDQIGVTERRGNLRDVPPL